MHSPVYQDYDPSFDTAEVWSDWEYYSDDYYDLDSPKKRRKFRDAENTATGRSEIGSGAGRKRRKLQPTDQISELTLGESLLPLAPVILWRSEIETDHVPVFSEGQEEKVALLKDWRERFKIPSQSNADVPKPRGAARQDSQTALAVVIDQRPSSKAIEGKELTVDKKKKKLEISSRIQVTDPRANVTATTASSTAKQRQKVSGTLKGVVAMKQHSKFSSERSASTQSQNKAPRNGMKRKASTFVEDDAHSSMINENCHATNSPNTTERPIEHATTQKEIRKDPMASERPTRRGKAKADTSVIPAAPTVGTRGPQPVESKAPVLGPLLNDNTGNKESVLSIDVQSEGSKGSLRKRKAVELEDGEAEPPAKTIASRPRGRPPGAVRGGRSKE